MTRTKVRHPSLKGTTYDLLLFLGMAGGLRDVPQGQAVSVDTVCLEGSVWLVSLLL